MMIGTEVWRQRGLEFTNTIRVIGKLGGVRPSNSVLCE